MFKKLNSQKFYFFGKILFIFLSQSCIIVSVGSYFNFKENKKIMECDFNAIS